MSMPPTRIKLGPLPKVVLTKVIFACLDTLKAELSIDKDEMKLPPHLAIAWDVRLDNRRIVLTQEQTVHPCMQLMGRPQTRSQSEHRFHGFREQLRQGKLLGAGESLLDVRYLPNGRLDFLSIDESARSQVNSMMHFANIGSPDDVEDPAQETD